jgi:HAD superfamily hydrolase (TIGR01509 family)
MDGVLVDTGEFHFQAWQEVLPDAGIPINPELFRQTFGMNNTDLITTLLGREPEPGLVADISQRKERRFRQLVAGRAHLLEGVEDWLVKLRSHHISQAVASSAPCENIDALVDELGIRPYFQAIVSGADMPGKPDPAVFLVAAHLLGIVPHACLVIEDSVAGVTAAKRAGMKCLAVTTTNPPEKLQQADLVFDALTPLAFSQALDLFSPSA